MIHTYCTWSFFGLSFFLLRLTYEELYGLYVFLEGIFKGVAEHRQDGTQV